jgi:hypothetical protein
MDEISATIKKIRDQGLTLQTVLVPRAEYTLGAAKLLMRKLSLRDSVDTKQHFYRFRQVEPPRDAVEYKTFHAGDMLLVAFARYSS